MNHQETQNSKVDPQSVRGRFARALAGEVVDRPVYAVYDWFVQNRPIDWPSLFDRGLGQINHVDLVRVERPHLEVIETTDELDGEIRRDVRWITDRGELREWWLGEWRQEFMIKKAEDYRILARALEDSRFTATSEFYDKSEEELGERGITLGHLGWTTVRRSPLLEVQIEFAGLQQCAMDVATETPELMELLELISELELEKMREAAKGPAQYIKLWENLSIDILGPHRYRKYLVPFYQKAVEVLQSAGKRLVVHYDGKLRLVADDIAALGFDGIDSLTPPPEGDMSMAEARAAWPEKFLWLHPAPHWFREDSAVLAREIRQMVREAGPRRYCLMISEDVPPDWQRSVPVVLETLDEMQLY